MQKTHIHQRIILLPMLLLLWMPLLTLAQSTSRETEAWFNSKSWLNGLHRTPTGTINKAEFARQYKANKAAWDKGFEYLRDTNLAALAPGRHPIDGDNVYAMVSEGVTKGKDEVLFEAHKRYADIHCMVTGQEQIGIAPFAETTLKTPYDAAKDIGFYTANGKYYVSDSSTIFILFPEKDAHCGGITVKDKVPFKKVVIKVRVVE